MGQACLAGTSGLLFWSLSAGHMLTGYEEPVGSSEQGFPPVGTQRARRQHLAASLHTVHSGRALPLMRLHGSRVLLEMAQHARRSEQCPILVSV